MKPKSSFHSLFPIVLAVFWLLVLALESYAQTLPKVRDFSKQQAAPGRFDQRFKKPKRPRATVVPVKPDSLKPVYPAELKKIEFVLKKLIIKGTTVYTKRDFTQFFKGFLKKRVNLLQIYQVAEAITTKYRNDGYILTRAIVPPQKIQDGIVKVEVIEGYLDKVSVKGRLRGPKKLLNAYRKKILRSRPLQAKDLERYLLLMDDLAGLSVKSILTASKKNSGASELIILLENKPFDAHLGVDNRGSEFNGPYQFFAGVTGNSLLGLYERTGIQGVVTNDTEELRFINLFVEAPINSEGTQLFLSASVSRSEPGESLKAFEVEGDSTTISGKLFHPFIRSRGRNLKGHLGFISRDTSTDILGALDSEDRLRMVEVGGSFDYADRFRGVNLISLNLRQGLNIFDATESGSPGLTRAGGKSDFTKVSGEFLRLQQLSSTWMLLGAMGWQYSFDKLLASEEFGVGGPLFGRGYDSSEITGDQGLAFKLELQKSIQVRKKFLRDLQVYAFFDYGSVWNRIKTSTLPTQQDLSSAGGGVRFNLTKWLSGYVEVAKPLSREVAAEGNKDPRLFFSIAARH